MISPTTIEQVRSAIDIVDVVQDYVALKKSGTVHKGCCPFHNERTPSFVVSPAKGIFKCFGCGVGGDAIGFIMKQEACEYPEAIKMLARKYNIAIEEKAYTAEEQAANDIRARHYHSSAMQADKYHQALLTNAAAMQYVQGRGMDADTLKLWNIGYAEHGFFAERIIFPIHDRMGRVAGFTGRDITGHSDAKYKNSPEAVGLFEKGKLLYGLYQSRQLMVKVDKVWLVEGQTDVIAMLRAGYPVVAPSGTAFTVDQMRLIARYTRNIVLLKDSDAAGIKSTIANIPTLVAEGMNVRIGVLPDGQDPDSYLQHNGNLYEVPEMDIILYIARIRAAEIEAEPRMAAQYLTELTELIAIMDDKNQRRLYMAKCAEIFGVPEGELMKDVRALIGTRDVHEAGRFYALPQATESIRELAFAELLFDIDRVTTRHMLGNGSNAIGLQGAELAPTEMLKLKAITNTIVVSEWPKAFDANRKESMDLRSLKFLFCQGFQVQMQQQEIADNGEINTVITNFFDYYLYTLTELIRPGDQEFIRWAIESIAELMSYLPETVRITKIDAVKGQFLRADVKFNTGDFKKVLNIFLKKNARIQESTTADMSQNSNLNLSKAQMDNLNQYQHYYDELQHAIYHIGDAGNIRRISNFTIQPIIHSNTSAGHFKLFEITNADGIVRQVSLETKDLNDLRRFKNAVESKGNYVFKGNQFQLDNIKESLYARTVYSNEVESLGWQHEGFWAWADGITTAIGEFRQTDENGIIQVDKQNFLIKPYSNLYVNDRTAFINEKKFRHLTSDITFSHWATQYHKVFGENTVIGIAALLTTVYGDAIFKLAYGELPLINYFGPKGAGKTQQADSLLAFFGEKQPINNITKVTVYGLSQTLKSFHNAFVLVDEYKNSLDMKWIEFLKSVYNRQGKIQGSLHKEGTKTEHIPINSMVLLCGQDLPTLDVALLDRCLCLTASKTEFTNDEINEYKKLKDMEGLGLAHITDMLISQRESLLSHWEKNNSDIQNSVSEKAPGVSTRLQKNLTTLLTPLRILMPQLGALPFSFDEALEIGISIIRTQQAFIESSDDLKSFWSIFMTLIEQKRIGEGRNYLLEHIHNIQYIGSEPITYGGMGKKILFIRWGGLYPLYAEYCKRSGVPALAEKTLLFYLENQKRYFLGKVRNKTFTERYGESRGRWVNDAWCFDYGSVNISLQETATDTDPVPDSPHVHPASADDLPF